MAVWRNFGGDGIPRGAVAAPSLEGSKASLEQHGAMEGVGWDEMILKVLPSPSIFNFGMIKSLQVWSFFPPLDRG